MKKNPFDTENGVEVNVEQPELVQINKSDIWEAMKENTENQSVKITKTSEEIKAQINEVLMPLYKKQLEEKEAQLAEILTKCGPAPTSEVRCYKIKLENFPYKEYDWCETNYCPEKEEEAEGQAISLTEQFTPSKEDLMEDESFEEEDYCNYPVDEVEAQNRVKYNEVLRQIVEIFIDLKTLDALLKIKDGQTFDLSVNQIIALKF